MTQVTERSIQRALVQTIKANTSLMDQVNGLHEGIAPKGTKVPFLTYAMVAAPYDDDWSKRTMQVNYDIFAWATDPVLASDLDTDILNTVQDSAAFKAALTALSQTTMYIRRIEGLRLVEIDEADNRLFRAGGTYLIWANQPL